MIQYRVPGAGLLFITLLLMAAPASAAVIAITNSSSVNATVAGAADGDTIVLGPGIYFEHGIVVSKNIALLADTAAGGSPENTIIDGMSTAPRIFTVNGGYTLSVDNLTLQNGHAADGADGISGASGSPPVAGTSGGNGEDGGAIASDGTVIVTSSVIANCSAGKGGNGGSGGTYTGSGSGDGADAGDGGTGGHGGAIATSGSAAIASLRITGCSAGRGGNGGNAGNGGGPSSLTCNGGKTGAGARGGSGGAVYAAGAATVTSTTISGCSAGNGGDRGNTPSFGSVMLYNNGGAGGSGGGICSGETVTVLSSDISACRAGTDGSNSVVIDQDGSGGAVSTASGGSIRFTRLVDDDSTHTYVKGTGAIDATGCWWGSNANPSANAGSTVTTAPYLTLTAVASPGIITPTQNTTVSVFMTFDSMYNDTSAKGHLPDAIPVTFNVAGRGSVSAPSAGLASGIASVTYTPSTTGGIGRVNATADNEMVTVTVIVPGPVAAPAAAFSVTPVAGTSPLTVAFTDRSTMAPTSWAWSFGDGETSAGKNPVHVYRVAGNYTVSLTAANAVGSNTTVKDDCVVVSRGLYLKSPVILSVTPASAALNTTVSFTLAGTNFQPGHTVVEFRNQTSAVVPAAITCVTATRVNGTVTIPAGALPGPWNIRVITASGGENTLTGKFTVTAVLAPVISTVVPATGAPNTTVRFTITGTNFRPGITSVTFRNASGTILNTTSLDEVTATRITGTIVIPAGATGAAYNVNVSTADGVSAPGTGRFSVVRQQPPSIASVSPATAARNTTVSLVITGSYFQPGQTSVVIRNASGTILNATAITDISTTRINATILVPPDAWIGSYNINITTLDGGSVPGTGRFAVTRFPAPAITMVSPASGSRNTTVSFTITGSNFQPGLTSVVFRNASGKILAVPAISSIAATSITGSIAIPANATAGAWNINITTADGGSVPGTGRFTVKKYPAPVLTTITPSAASRNTTITFTITGTNFQPGLTSVVFRNASGAIGVVSDISRITATGITGSIFIPSSAPAGAWNVNITTADGGSVPGTGRFTVNRYPAPAILSVTPATVYRNTTAAFEISGSNFAPGQTTVNLTRGSDTVILAVSSCNATVIRGTAALAGSTVTGLRDITVHTVDGGNVTKIGAVTVL